MDADGKPPSLLSLLLLELPRRRNLDDFFAAAVGDDVAAMVTVLSSEPPPLLLDNGCIVLLLEDEYLDGFKILDTDSLTDAHLWRGWHFFRRRKAALLSPDDDDCDGCDDDSSLDVVSSGSGEGCLRVNVADRLNSKSAARPLRRGLRCLLLLLFLSSLLVDEEPSSVELEEVDPMDLRRSASATRTLLDFSSFPLS